ncbi:MAG: DUF268 domain-containing protein [Bacteroidetes bacterium]|nr:DUF268 domain-containing protein [Bacteroidota bacterium]
MNIKNLIERISTRLNFNKHFKRDFNLFLSLSTQTTQRFNINWKDVHPINEKTEKTDFDRHYVYHTSWAARYLAKTKPEKHVDISSSLFFSGICSAFVKIEFYDYRPADLILNNLVCKPIDLIKLPFESNSIQSLSCMHTVEHIGLGRYGDNLDPDGDLKAINELRRVLAPNGNLLFVVPIGKPKIIFNAHRIYSHEQITEYFKDLRMIEFALIPENGNEGGLVINPPNELIMKQDYGCGCYWFKK